MEAKRWRGLSTADGFRRAARVSALLGVPTLASNIAEAEILYACQREYRIYILGAAGREQGTAGRKQGTASLLRRVCPPADSDMTPKS